MDSFFGIGFPELVLILLLAGLVMGPHRIRHVARILGRVTAQLQRISREFTRQLNAELDAVDSGEIKGALSDMRSLQEEVEALRRELSSVPRSLRQQGEDVIAEGKAAMSDGKAAISGLDPGKASDAETLNNGEKVADHPTESSDDEKPPLPRLLDIPEDPE
jgi:Sec-independent protein translocase protein TatA